MENVTRLFDVPEKTVHLWIKLHGLPVCRVKNQYRFNRTDLLEWALANQVSLSSGMLEHEGPVEPALPSLAEALAAGGIHPKVVGRDKAAVLSAIVALLRLPEAVDRSLLLEALLVRESLGSTAIGEGIAIPHPRHPIVLNVGQPIVTLCFLEHPIDFEALDDQPVGILFTLITPTTRSHLRLLSRLMFVLRAPEVKQALVRDCRSPEAILRAIAQAENALMDYSSPPAKNR